MGQKQHIPNLLAAKEILQKDIMKADVQLEFMQGARRQGCIRLVFVPRESRVKPFPGFVWRKCSMKAN